ncbi:MAG: PQQ-binding-like beta-propeller repeat protein [Pseudomonadota bacterium]
MSDSRLKYAAFAACLMLGACQIFGGGGNDDEELDKSGRIDMVLGEEAVSADPALATVAVALPPAELIESWPQAGRRATKVVGHAQAAEALEIAWRTDAGQGTTRNGALAAPPVASGELIFVLDADQTVRAFDVADGDRRWTRELKSGLRRDRRGLGGGLALEGDTLIVASGFGTISALNATTGDELWSRRLNAPVTGSPTIKDNRIFVSTQNNEVFALDFQDGATQWSDQAISEPARVLSSPSPAAVEDIVVAPYSSGEVIAYLASNGRRLWSDALTRSGRFTPISAINDVASRPVLAGGLVFAVSQSGVLAAIDGRSGNRVWAQPFGSVQAPSLVGNFLFVSGIEGQIACFQAQSGGVIWATDLPRYRNERKNKGRIAYTAPVVASNRILVVSSEEELLVLSPQTGEITDRIDINATVYLEPIVVGDKVVLLADDGRLIAIR